jgi:hypothetical protein
MTIEIKINGNIREIIQVRYISEPINEPVAVVMNKVKWGGEREYMVNETYKIKHNRKNGHRELARLALEAIRRAR